MKLSEGIHLVGSGSYGFDLTDAFDCNIYLLDGGDELALVDAGAGLGAEAVVENVRRDGLDPARIRHVILTHAHGDHAGGAARLRSLLDAPTIYLSAARAEAVRTADEETISLGDAKRAGIYPPDYRFDACPVDVELADGDEIAVGHLVLRAVETPGHADGHVSLQLDREGRRSLFAGDLVFHGGKVLLQAIHDCRLDALVQSLRRLRDSEIDALFPGHLAFSLDDGQRHIERANQVLDRLLIPEQIVGAW